MKIHNKKTMIKFFCAISLLLPISVSIVVADYQGEENFIDQMNTYSFRVLNRTNRVINHSKETISQLSRFRAPPCSNQHIEEMRRVVLESRYVREVIYMDKIKPLCSSTGESMRLDTFPPPMRKTRDGYSAWLIPRIYQSGDRAMIELGTEDYLVIIDPSSLIDEIPLGIIPAEVAMADSTSHIIFAYSKRIDSYVVSLMEKNEDQPLRYRGSLYVARKVPEQGIMVITWSSLRYLQAMQHQQILVWLPVGLLISFASIYSLLRVMKRSESMPNRLAEAINNRALAIHYQPIVDLNTGVVVGAEALVRWPLPDGSYISPVTFIPVAESAGLISKITHLVIEMIFDDLGSWLHSHPEQHISINVAPSDIISGSLMTLIKTGLMKWNVHPRQIALELTERIFIDPKIISPAIATFRRTGHSVYLDDFGTGYSSLGYLQELNVDTIKIDKSFVDALEIKNVTPHIIEMAKSLELTMVAEGIETEAQLFWLRSHGVHHGQGWIFSKALPKNEFISWFNAKHTRQSIL
ncbi:EAL domain-containing protein [Enterobacter ludwigii]|uniref:EAL domain-containing protein n=1 Tax=Enterobacter ludwigii TaxID=299767 RepID=UPI00159C9673|nr:EAL domain-containing protein [Enterobacter ludwigii]QLA06298.1 EAL domain-containing protein [Enterobacter ludwigii]